MALPVNGNTHLIPAYYSFIDPGRMKGWVGLVGWLVAVGLPILVVTHQLQVERRTGKVRQSETDVLPLCHANIVVGYNCIADATKIFWHGPSWIWQALCVLVLEKHKIFKSFRNYCFSCSMNTILIDMHCWYVVDGSSTWPMKAVCEVKLNRTEMIIIG